jgi:hypothetical protein
MQSHQSRRKKSKIMFKCTLFNEMIQWQAMPGAQGGRGDRTYIAQTINCPLNIPLG